MSEIQRFAHIWKGDHAVVSDDQRGAYCYYTDLLWYRRQWVMQAWLTILMVVVCAVLAALLVQAKASRGPVQVPIGAAERADMLKEREASAKQIKDLKALKVNYEAQIRHLNARMSTTQAQIDIVSPKIDSALNIAEHVSQLNKEQAQRMGSHQGVVLEAKRVLGVNVVIK